MGQLYMALHAVTGEEPPEGSVCQNARFLVMSTIVAPSVQLAYEEVYDSEIEEHTPEERAAQLLEEFMLMSPEEWWNQQLVFVGPVVERHALTFAWLLDHPDVPPYPEE